MDYYLITVLALTAFVLICSEIILVLCIIRLKCSSQRKREQRRRKSRNCQRKQQVEREHTTSKLDKGEIREKKESTVNQNYREIASRETLKPSCQDSNVVHVYETLTVKYETIGLSENKSYIERPSLETEVRQCYHSETALYENQNQATGSASTQLQLHTAGTKCITGRIDKNEECTNVSTALDIRTAQCRQVQVRAQVHESFDTYENTDNDHPESQEYSYVTASEISAAPPRRQVSDRKIMEGNHDHISPQDTVGKSNSTVSIHNGHSGIAMVRNDAYLTSRTNTDATIESEQEQQPLGTLTTTINPSYKTFSTSQQNRPSNEKEQPSCDGVRGIEREISDNIIEPSVQSPSTCGYDKQGKFYYDC